MELGAGVACGAVVVWAATVVAGGNVVTAGGATVVWATTVVPGVSVVTDAVGNVVVESSALLDGGTVVSSFPGITSERTRLSSWK